MIEQTGETYLSSPYAKTMAASEAKVGKTCFLIAGALGCLPWQKHGGIVDKPENLHVIATDSNAIGGVKRFLLETCRAPKEALNFKVYNMQADLLLSSGSDNYDYTFLNTINEILQKVHERKRGVPLVLGSSLTGIAEGLLNGLRSPAGENKGGGMDISKWSDFALQVTQVRNTFHAGDWHTIWEAHVLKMIRKGQGETVEIESIQVPGQSGVNFPYNVEQFFRIRRMYGQKWEGSNCDKVYLDPRPTYGFITNGRNFNEALNDKEYDPAIAFHKLGLTIGRWNSKSSKPKPVAKQQKE